MISIAMCTYNGEKYVKQQLESIICQTQAPDEIVICDDCSNDNTISIIKKTLEKWSGRVILIKNERNIGYKKNFEKCLSLCSGDIIFLSDQDDIWDLRKIEIIYHVFQMDSSISMVFHDVCLVNNQMEIIAQSFWKILRIDIEKIKNRHYEQLLVHNIVQGSACALRKDVFDVACPFPTEAIHDEWLALEAITVGKLVPVSTVLMKYRQAENIIGGTPLSFHKKIIKWTINIHSSMQAHYNEVTRRNHILKVYCDRICKNKKQILSSDVISLYLSFLEARIEGMNYNKLRICMNLFLYFKYYKCDIAIKFFIKDLLSFGHSR